MPNFRKVTCNDNTNFFLIKTTLLREDRGDKEWHKPCLQDKALGYRGKVIVFHPTPLH